MSSFARVAILQLASNECIELGPHLMWYDYREKPGKRPSDTTLTIWLPLDRVHCKFARTSDKRTILEIERQFFHAGERLQLPADCPENIVFCATFTQEEHIRTRRTICGKQRMVSVIEPRLLVYDYFDSSQQEQFCYSERYEKLRTELYRYIATSGDVAIIQWAGHLSAAETLLANDPGFGHVVEKLAMPADTPCELTIPLHVYVPNNRVVRFQ